MFLNKARDFINSVYFIYAIAAVVAVVWMTGWEIAGIVILILFAATMLLFQRNCSPFVAVSCLVYFALSRTQVPDGVTESVILSEYTWLVILGAVIVLYLVFCVIFHLVKFPSDKARRFNLNKSFVVILIAIALAGLFSPQFNIVNNGFIFTSYLVLFVVYLIYSSGGIKDFKHFIAHIAVAVGIVLLFECVVFYTRVPDAFAAIRDKWLELGWGIGNNVAPLLCFSVAMSLYLYVSKNRTVYFVLAVLFAAGVVLTLSRGNILSLGIALPFMAYFVITKSVNKKKSAIFIGITAALLIAVAVWQWPLIAELFEKMFDRGLDDNGRCELWGAFAELFKQNPVFGNGFYDAKGLLYMPHSVILIIASGMGTVGLLAFGYHYYKKYSVLFTYKSTFNIFAFFTAFMFVAYSFIDMDFFMIFQHFIIFAILEAAKQEREEMTVAVEKETLLTKFWLPLVITGVAVAVLSVVFLFNAPTVTAEGLPWLSTFNYIASCVMFVAAGVLTFGGVDGFMIKRRRKTSAQAEQ